MAPRDREELGGTPPGGLTRTVVRGVGVSGLGFVLTQVLTLGIYLTLARLATPDDFGELAAGAIVVNVGIQLFGVESGILTALIHRRDRVEEAMATAVVSTLLTGLVFTGLAFAVSPLVGAFFDSGRIGSVAAATSGLMLLRTACVVPMAMLQRRFSFARRVVVEPLGVIAFGATAIATTANGLGVWGLVLGFYARALVDVVLSWSLVGWRPQMNKASFDMWRELVGYARHVFAATVVQRLNDQVPAALLGRFVGSAQLGQFRYGIRTAALPFSAALAAASYVLFPAFARIAEDPARFRQAFTRALGWMAVIGMPGGFIMLGLGAPAATLLYGPDFADAGDAAMALCVFVAAGVLVSVITEAFSADGRPELLVRIHLVEALVGIVAMIALLRFELVGVAAGVSLGVAVGATYAIWKAQRVFEIPWRTIASEITPPFVAAVVMGISALILDTTLVQAADQETFRGIGLLLAETIFALSLYAVVLHLLDSGRAGEMRDLIRQGRGAAGPGPATPQGIDTVPTP
jgi:O-antigen/teichoic acid export membrane protein